MNRILVVLLVFGLTALSTLESIAHDGTSCAQCQMQKSTTKICRLKVTEKKIEVVCWGCETEEFCVPGPSLPKCQHCETIICQSTADKSGADVSSKPKKFLWTEWLPGCAKVFTKKKLMKRTIEKSIPSTKWVVEEVCRDCQGCLTEVPAGHRSAALPAVPSEFEHLPRYLTANEATLISETLR